MPVSTTTQAAIDAALTAKGTADTADGTLTAAQGALAQAQQGVTAATAADLAAHKDAADKAHAAVNALLADLGQPAAF